MELVADAAYSIQWHRISPQNRLGVMLLIARNQHIKPITGFGPIKATLETFISVWNILNMLL